VMGNKIVFKKAKILCFNPIHKPPALPVAYEWG